MKLKELKRAVNVCWSPAEHYPITLAAGSAAQQVDASFSSSSFLELYTLNLDDPGFDLELKSSTPTQQKFQKIVWSGAEIIVGGCDGGLLQFYSSEKLLKCAPDSLLGTSNKHSGNVTSLDINPYQKNLLASGASESEIFIWDLNNTSQPMAPGNRSQPLDHVQGLAWNQQVQHILGSTFATRCVVWDLRKNEPIMKLSDAQSRTRWRSLAWHPAVATQLCLASEDDSQPVIQIWDLRLAASPLVTLEGHSKGVASVSWCAQDPGLLLSAGKDGRVLCWDPSGARPSGPLLSEISAQPQWVHSASWCPRDPSLLVSASFEQLVSVHSLMGGSRPDTSTSSQNNMLESFGGAALGQLPAVTRSAAPQAAPLLPVAPKWLKRPSGAKFAFGGKLVTFDRCPQEDNTPKQVQISQVVSEPEIVKKAEELDRVLASEDATVLAEYCRSCGEACSEQSDRTAWYFLRANFLPTAKDEMLNLLGFKQDEVPSKFKTTNIGDATTLPDPVGLSREAHTLIERKLANLELEPTVNNVVIPNGEDATSVICRALVCGHLEEAVELCLDARRIADALVIASLGSPELLCKVQKYHLNASSQDPVSLISGSLLLSRWQTLVMSSAADSWRASLAALLTHCDGEQLAHYCEMLGDRLSRESEPSLQEAATVCYLAGMAPDALVAKWSVSDTDTELALLVRRAAAHRGRHIQSGGPLEAAVSAYAAKLAAQGCLACALRALDMAPGAALRARLVAALHEGRATQPQQQQQFGRTRTVSSHSQKSQYAANNFAGYNQDARYAPSQPTWGAQPLPHQPLQPQPLQPLQPPQPSQPPRPSSVGPQQGGLTTRSKYKVDPSVQSSQNYNQYGFNNPITSQPQSYGYNSPLPDQYQNSSVPNTFTPINPNTSLNPLNPGLTPANQINPTLNPLNPGINPLNPSVNPVNQLNPAVNGSYYNSQQADAIQSKPVQSGWNDPPMPSSKSKPKQEVQAQAPITHPLFGVEPPQHVPLAPIPGQYPGQQAQFPGQQAQFPGQQAQYPGQFDQYPGQQAQYQQQQYPGQFDQYQQQYQQGMTQGYQQQEPLTAPEPPAPIQKAPIPEQHVALQTMFDAIRAECVNRAANPQMKRKLEDVQRRLENLYDLLREYKLSETGLQTLHSVSQYISSRDYNSALGAAAALASGADFAAAASFLPGLKVLIQLADQLQVYAG